MKYIHYTPKNLTLIGLTIFGDSVYRSRSGRIYEFHDEYILSISKKEYFSKEVSNLNKYRHKFFINDGKGL